MIRILRCTKDFYMDDGSKAFSKGKDYPILQEIIFDNEPSDFLVISELGRDEHIMPWDDMVKEHFDLIEE